MKKYLFGLGAMLVGAGLMFVFTHAEVRAEGEAKVDVIQCQVFKYSNQVWAPTILGQVNYCKIRDVICVGVGQGLGSISCVKE